MDKFSFTSGLKAIDALQKLWDASDSFKLGNFTNRFTEMTKQLDERGNALAVLVSSPKTDEKTKKKYASELEEIALTLTELKKLADCVYDQFKTYPGNMPKPIENAWAIYCRSIWGKAKKELFPFIYGFRAGNIYALKYGNAWKK